MMVLVLTLAAASLEQGSSPAPGVAKVAAIGAVVYERFQYQASDGVEIEAGAPLRYFLIDFPVREGDRFVTVESRKGYKACLVVKDEPCLIDDDGDGRFDRWSQSGVIIIHKLKQSLAYHAVRINQALAHDDFRWRISYLGLADHALKLSYREFNDDLARPAFTEDYAIPLGPVFPQTIVVKDVRFSVSAIDGEGLHYTVVP
jgi:hypothetical protein